MSRIMRRITVGYVSNMSVHAGETGRYYALDEHGELVLDEPLLVQRYDEGMYDAFARVGWTPVPHSADRRSAYLNVCYLDVYVPAPIP